jgi:hypothetical protein
MSGLDDLERKLKHEVDKELAKFDNKSQFEKDWEMNRARMGAPSFSSISGGLKIVAYWTVKGVRKIRDNL